jgi:hypothetical protein
MWNICFAYREYNEGSDDRNGKVEEVFPSTRWKHTQVANYETGV